MQDKPLLGLPLNAWTYEMVNEFLEARVPEDDRVEYKEKFSDKFHDTLVSFANGEGGYIFVGVSENPPTKTPKTWPLLPDDKDYLSTVYNIAGAQTIPPVRPLARRFEGVDRNRLVVVRVERGENPPYFAKQRGVLVRVGDTDIHADPRTLEILFARRGGAEDLRSGLRNGLWSNPVRGGMRDDELGYSLVVAPLFGRHRLSFNERITNELRELVAASKLKVDAQERRREDRIDYEDGNDPAPSDHLL